jgi:hypothetical protein
MANQKQKIKDFSNCIQALDFIDELKKRYITGNLHSRREKSGYVFSVSWTPKKVEKGLDK